MPRGQKFNTRSSEAIIPAQQITMSARDPLESHTSVGAYQ